MYRDSIKRTLDIILALLILIPAAPIMVIASIAIMLDSPGGAIFKQDRIGLNGKVFKVLKFRSMYVDSEKRGSGVYSDDNDPRQTRIGRIIRKTSIDELPQLINVLRGDMSFIGPRPPLTYHPWTYEEYTDFQKRMFEVRPGISGWAQINGRKAVEWHKRIKLNVWYVDHCSFAVDCLIFFKTIFKVLSNADNTNSTATVETKEESKVD